MCCERRRFEQERKARGSREGLRKECRPKHPDKVYPIKSRIACFKEYSHLKSSEGRCEYNVNHSMNLSDRDQKRAEQRSA